MKRPTQKDIADALGLSQTTVTIALTISPDEPSGRLKQATVRKIHEKARELGYRPHRAARAMRKGRSNLLVHLNFGGSSETAALRNFHIGRLIHQAGYDFRTIEGYWWISDAASIMDQVLSLQPEGVIVSGALQAPFRREDFDVLGDIPLVMLGSLWPGVPGVIYGAEEAFCKLTTHCIEQGARRLVLLTRQVSMNSNWQTLGKIQGFQDALAAAGARFLPNRGDGWDDAPDICGTVIGDAGRRSALAFHDGGSACMQEMLSWDRCPDAVICTNDVYAVGALSHCLRRGVRVPEECMITGFDNLSVIRHLPCLITTMEQPVEQMCEKAISLLIDRLQGVNEQPLHHVLPCTSFLPGESTQSQISPVSKP